MSAEASKGVVIAGRSRWLWRGAKVPEEQADQTGESEKAGEGRADNDGDVRGGWRRRREGVY